MSNGLILTQSSASGGSKYTLKSFSELKRPIGVIAFEKNLEYQTSEEFSANRMLVSGQKTALLNMCDIKKSESLKTSAIIKISGVEDYKIYEDFMLE